MLGFEKDAGFTNSIDILFIILLKLIFSLYSVFFLSKDSSEIFGNNRYLIPGKLKTAILRLIKSL